MCFIHNHIVESYICCLFNNGTCYIGEGRRFMEQNNVLLLTLQHIVQLPNGIYLMAVTALAKCSDAFRIQ